jgi:isovaleryl-CoA dehydrogenase
VGDIFEPTPEHAALRHLAREFTEAEVDPQAMDADRSETFNVALFRRLGQLGLLGITVPEQFGGAGMDATAAVIVHEEISAADPAFCLSYLAHAILFANNLYQNASDEQRARWLPDACAGRTIGGMCMSEPAAGTDALAMQTTAKRTGDHYVVNGTKMWITNGAVSDTDAGDVFLVYARTGDKGTKSLSQLVVEKSSSGFRLGQKIKDKLGMRASTTAELVFEDCVVPAANLVGREGDAARHMMRNLEIERLTLAAISLGIARRCVEVMNRYARERKAFGKPINEFGQIQRHIGESYAGYMAGRAYVYQTAASLDLSRAGTRLDSDGVKLFCATMAKEVADRAVQVLGGYGYVGVSLVVRLGGVRTLLPSGGAPSAAPHNNPPGDRAPVDRLE